MRRVAVVEALPHSKPDHATIFEGLVFAAILIDPAGTIVELNQAAEMQLSQSKKKLVGSNILDKIELLDPRVLDRLQNADGPLIARNLAIKVCGTGSQINLTVSPISDHAGWRVLTLSDVGRDDTDGRQYRDFHNTAPPSILAHEIRNPLAAIRGAAQLVSRKLQQSDRALGKVITDEVDRIARLVDRVQQLGNSTQEDLEPVNLHEVIRAALASIRAAGTDGVELREVFDPSLPPVLADRDALEQVVMNLVRNAVEALRSDGTHSPKITIQTRFQNQSVFGQGRDGTAVKLPVEIIVTDNGPGVDAGLQDLIFEPFITSKKSGQGLGLALVRKLVRDMQGRITHERDTKDELTHFRVYLALAEGNFGA